MTVIVESPSSGTPPDFSNLVPLHTLPISERPRKSWRQFLDGVAFGVLFILGCVLINVAHIVVLLPLRALPFGRALYDTGIRKSKEAFGALLGGFCRSKKLSFPLLSPSL